MTSQLDRFQATILGLACGDALGAPTEFKHMASIRRLFGPNGIQDLTQTSGGRYTDDTQMAEALGRGLLDAHKAVAQEYADAKVLDHPVCTADIRDVHFVMPHVAKRFVEWSVAPYNNRAPGGTCLAGCSALRSGKPWTKSGVMGSKGCGSVMRSAPVGLVYLEPQLGEMGRASSLMTHGHQAALDAAHLGALAVRLLLEDEAPENLCALLLNHAIDENMKRLLMAVELAVQATLEGHLLPEKVQTHNAAGSLSLGESWVGDEALASALYCFLLAHARGEGYVETVRYGANTDGDSDSIACIAGQFAGAFWGLGGLKGLPESWAALVERTDELRQLGTDLYELHLAIYKG